MDKYININTKIPIIKGDEYNKSPLSRMTIVTAFIGNINEREDRKIEHYLEYGNQLLNVYLPKIVFMDKETYNEHFLEKADSYPLTKFIPIEKKDLYLFNYKDVAYNYEIVTGNPKKDTIEFMFVQCMKTEWIKQAIEMNIYNTEQFAWVDFGILHFIKDVKALNEGLKQMSTKNYDKVRIPCGKPPDFPYFSRNVYHQIIWMFIGSLFGGGKSALLHFAKIMKEKCIEILEEKHHLMWEINIWYLLFFENVNVFDRYISDHSPKILLKY